MNLAFLPRRLLTTFRVSRISHRFADVLVVGSGVGGLSAALAAAIDGRTEVLVLAKGALTDCATQWAQGGVAAVLEPERCDDSLAAHVADTVEAGCGLCDPSTVELVVREGVDAVRELISAGAVFDVEDGHLHFTREGGHSRPRIVHREDRTGREILRVLLDAVGPLPNVATLEGTFAIDLLLAPDGRCRGALVCRPGGHLEALWARRVVLATGGAGRLYRETTNPPVTTGDGLAMALRAGATLRDMEFVQFHPTTLYVAGADRFLISEAVRGEGATLVDSSGERFMTRFHPSGELAPRDVVSRGIVERMRETGDNRVYLDLSPIPPEKIRERFPYIARICGDFGIDITREPVPVRPSAHYTIGGIRVDHDGVTDVPGLLAVGEVTSTGLHGANRLASNSLLEGLVFGRRAGARAGREALRERSETLTPVEVAQPEGEPSREAPAGLDLQDLQRSLQSLLWRDVGIERRREGLVHARDQIAEWASYVLPLRFANPTGWTLQNMLTTASAIVHGALTREESRGVHFRADFPEPLEAWRRHVDVSRRERAP